MDVQPWKIHLENIRGNVMHRPVYVTCWHIISVHLLLKFPGNFDYWLLSHSRNVGR